jgi:predicted DNA repair protein MutK
MGVMVFFLSGVLLTLQLFGLLGVLVAFDKIGAWWGLWRLARWCWGWGFRICHGLLPPQG